MLPTLPFSLTSTNMYICFKILFCYRCFVHVSLFWFPKVSSAAATHPSNTEDPLTRTNGIIPGEQLFCFTVDLCVSSLKEQLIRQTL